MVTPPFALDGRISGAGTRPSTSLDRVAFSGGATGLGTGVTATTARAGDSWPSSFTVFSSVALFATSGAGAGALGAGVGSVLAAIARVPFTGGVISGALVKSGPRFPDAVGSTRPADPTEGVGEIRSTLT